MATRALALRCVVCALVLGARLFAGAQASRVVSVEGATPELLARIEGQTRDLGVSVVPAGEASGEPLARVRIEPRGDGGYLVTVDQIGTGEHSERQVQPAAPTDRLGSSATLEAIALLVRAAVAGAQLAAPVPPAPAPPPVPSTHAPPTPSPAPTARVPAVASRQPPAGAQLAAPVFAAGYEGAVAGDAQLAHAFALRFAFAPAALRLGLQLALGLRYELADARSELALRRHRLGLDAELPIACGRGACLLAGAAASLLLFTRSTATRDASLEATPSGQSLGPAFGAQLRAQLYFTRAVGVELSAGGDAVLSPPRYVYALAAGAQEPAHGAYLQPRAALLLLSRF